MKCILFLCDNYFPGQTYQENLLAKYYMKLGLRVVVLASTETSVFNYYNGKGYNIPESHSIADGISLYRLPTVFNFFGKIKIYKGVKNILFHELPDFIFVHGVHFNLHNVKQYKKKYKQTKVILDVHSDFVNSANGIFSRIVLHSIIRGNYLRRNIKCINKLYSVVPGGIDFIEKLYHVRREMVELFPLGSDLDLAKPYREDEWRTLFRSQYGITNDDKVVFTGGKIAKEKNLHVLIKAISSFSNVYLFIVGDFIYNDSEYRNRILDMINNSPRVYFLGWLPGVDMYKVMAGCDFAIFPGSQTVLWQQSMGLGLPTVIVKYFKRNNEFIDQQCNYLQQGTNVYILDGRFDLYSEIIHSIRVHSVSAYLNTAREDTIRFADIFLDYESLAKRSLIFNCDD